MSNEDLLLNVVKELEYGAKLVDEATMDALGDLILKANRVFIAGSGRSGFVGRGFANRMMHLGITDYFVGDTTTPSIREGDLLIVLSGSGTTASHISNTKVAKKEGATVATITIFPNNTIGKLADLCVVLPGVTSKVEDETNNVISIQPMGNMFEQLTWLVCDTVLMKLKAKLKQSEEQMHYRHANME